ncbi:uncharacterized protein LOC121877388 [Homarus americanus]|uniref:uncharacterized protein LOC121877388 n=1 Tax=Homarus americanus TaxID=6706 RepID=UPI001C43E8A1|nr:uncharacterized protein LOC121877388 [Homarus americanus]
MSDDAPQPPSSFYNNLSCSFAKLTHFIDNNIRIIQYCIYVGGAAGVLLVLHSARAFTKFVHIQDIPKEFITKHVRLHGHVRWVGATPPMPALLPPDKHSVLPHIKNGSKSSPSNVAEATTRENLRLQGPKSLSEGNRGIYEGAGELHPWENDIDPDVTRIYYDEDLRPLFLKVEHAPVIPLQWQKSDNLLPLQLADVEVTGAGVAHVRAHLLRRRTWFTLISHNTDDNTLVSLVKPAKLFSRSINEQLVREGLALTAPMDLELHHDPCYIKHYKRLLQAQEYAEKKQLGMWKLPKEQRGGFLQLLWCKIRSLVARKKQ